MALSLYTAPTTEAVSLDEARTHLKLDATTDDAYVAGVLIPAAIGDAERFTGRALLSQTWDWKLDGFPLGDAWIVMPKAPLISVTSVTYLDEDGASQTWAAANYIVDAPAGPRAVAGRIALAYGCSWPSTRYVINAVTIRFVCGYGTTVSTVPAMIRAGILLRIGDLYLNRDGGLPPLSEAIERCWRPYQVW